MRHQQNRPEIPAADRDAVLHAFSKAETTLDGYRAAVAEWQRRHPEHHKEYAAARAVDAVLESRTELLLRTKEDPMSWENLPERIRKARTAWGMSVSKNGGVTIWFPEGHALNKAQCVITQIGKGDDAGWIRLVPSRTGRKVMVPVKAKAKPDDPRFVKYSTLPGAPGELSMTELETRPDGDAVKIKLPWRVPGAPFSMNTTSTSPARANVR